MDKTDLPLMWRVIGYLLIAFGAIIGALSGLFITKFVENEDYRSAMSAATFMLLLGFIIVSLSRSC